MDFDSLGWSRMAFNYSIINPIIHWFYSKYFIFFKGTTAKKKKTTRRTMRGKQDENIQVFGGHMWGKIEGVFVA